jgi:hypothetical protein
MKINIIPIEKESNFLKKHEEIIRTAAKQIQTIRTQTRDMIPMDMIDARKRMIDEYCPVKIRSRKVAESPRIVESENFVSIEEPPLPPPPPPDEASLAELGDL